MDLRLASLTLCTLLILVTSGPQPSIGEKVYTNAWAVHITGGEQEANRIASKHGFVNHGNVSVMFRQVIIVCVGSLGLGGLLIYVHPCYFLK
ncbi:hypothetical protein PO909_024345 [Leuciscus waleckii]